MPNRGIVLHGRDEVIESRAAKAGLPVEIGDRLAVPFEKTLFVEPGTRVPWDLLPVAWHFLERWDAAVPLWRYGMTAEDVGTKGERAETAVIVRDLRVLLHSVELLFVRQNEAGCVLMERWGEEGGVGGEPRLAFLRALYQVKPRLCVLPTTWLAAVRQYDTVRQRQPRRQAQSLVTIEVSPGRMVKVHAGEERRIRQLAENGRFDMATLSSKSFTVSTPRARAAKGPLVKVQIAPGRFVKMYEVDAIAQGHISPPDESQTMDPVTKSRPPQEDKVRPPQEDKSAKEEMATADADDFTSIEGVGPATARLIGVNGITSFAQLRQADVSFLSGTQQKAIEAWRADG